VKICVGVYVQILPKGFVVCANALIVVKITVAVEGKSGNKTAKINVKNLFGLLLSVRVMTDDLYYTTKTAEITLLCHKVL